MEIKGKVHCFFEQSGTFKNEFIKLGIHAKIMIYKTISGKLTTLLTYLPR